MKYFISFAFAMMLLTPTISAAQQKPTPVFITPVKSINYVDEVEALGTLNANENVNLVSTVTERITAVHFQDNQRVKKGDLLVEMDTAEEEAELIEEKSRRDEALRQVNRLRPLVDKGAASVQLLDEQERELNTSNARIRAIESRIKERRIIAPFDGVLGIRNISVGDLALPGVGNPDTLITTIDDDSVMKLDFSVPEVFISSLKEGLSIKAKASAYEKRIFEGTIASINSRVDPLTRSVVVRAILENQEGLLKAGMLMRVKLYKNPRNALVLPEEAITSSGTTKAVMVIEQGEQPVATRRVVTIGERRKGEVEIIDGLDEGELVITHGGLRIRDGSSVTIKATDQDNAPLGSLLKQGDEE